MKSSLHRKGELIVDKPNFCLPGDLDQLAIPIGQSFAKIFRRQIIVLQNLPSPQIHQADRRLSILPRTLIQMSVQINEALRECIGIVRISVDNLKTVGMNRLLRISRNSKK